MIPESRTAVIPIPAKTNCIFNLFDSYIYYILVANRQNNTKDIKKKGARYYEYQNRCPDQIILIFLHQHTR